MTLAQLRNRADAILTPLWQAVRDTELAYYKRFGTYRDVSVRKLHLPAQEKCDVYARVVADNNGFSLQVLADDGTNQYARGQGYGDGVTFDWKKVTVDVSNAEGEYAGPPQSMKFMDHEDVIEAFTDENGDGTSREVPRRVIKRGDIVISW